MAERLGILINITVNVADRLIQLKTDSLNL